MVPTFTGNTELAPPNSEIPNAFLIIFEAQMQKGYRNPQFSTVFIRFPERRFALPQNHIFLMVYMLFATREQA